MTEIVQVFQLGSSTVVTLPKKLGIKPVADAAIAATAILNKAQLFTFMQIS